jgi:hypothetical protein
MNGVIIEYVDQGFPTIEVQLDAEEAKVDKAREVLSVWHFEGEAERDVLIKELRRFREQQLKGKA